MPSVKFLMLAMVVGFWPGHLATCAPLLCSTLQVQIITITVLLIIVIQGITVMKELSGTSRAVLDNIRIVVIWGIFLIPLGPYLCRLQDGFNYVAVIL